MPKLPAYKDKRYLLSGLIRHRPENAPLIELRQTTIDHVLSTCDPPRDPIEAVDRLLGLALSRTDAASDWIRFESTDYPLLYSRGQKELDWLILKARELGYLDYKDSSFNLTLRGWQKVVDLRNAGLEQDSIRRDVV